MPSLLEAIAKKYGDNVDAALGDDMPIAIHVPRVNPRKYLPGVLVLNNEDIDTAGDDDEQIRDKCSSVQELDLAHNKLQHWDQVFSILCHMQNLVFLNLSFNSLNAQQINDSLKRFVSHDDSENGSSGADENGVVVKQIRCFPHLRSLVLNSTFVTWDNVHALLRITPGLEELHLSLNDYSSVPPPSSLTTSTVSSVLTTSSMSTSAADSGIDVGGGFAAATHSPASPLPTIPDGVVDPAPESTAAVGALVVDVETTVPAPVSTPVMSSSAVAAAESSIADGDVPSPDVTSSCAPSSVPVECFPSLRRLHFCGNPVHSWPSSVCSLGTMFPSLECLVVADCPLENVTCDRCDRCFANLNLLNLNNTNLPSWDCVDELKKFPALRDIRIQGVPFLEPHDRETRRHHLIARLPNVERVNGGASITANERDRAERSFVRYYAGTWQNKAKQHAVDSTRSRTVSMQSVDGGAAAAQAGDEVVVVVQDGHTDDAMDTADEDQSHNFTSDTLGDELLLPARYHELVRVHGPLSPMPAVSLRPAVRVNVTVVWQDSRQQQEINVTNTVAELKEHLAAKIGLTAGKIRLFYVDKEIAEMDGSGVEELKYSQRKLHGYQMQAGDEIIIELKQ